MATHETLDELEADVGRQIRALRKRAGITQEELARNANLSTGTIRNLETGAGSTLATLISVLRVLERTDWLTTIAPPVSVSPLALLEASEKDRRA